MNENVRLTEVVRLRTRLEEADRIIAALNARLNDVSPRITKLVQLEMQLDQANATIASQREEIEILISAKDMRAKSRKHYCSPPGRWWRFWNNASLMRPCIWHCQCGLSWEWSFYADVWIVKD